MTHEFTYEESYGPAYNYEVGYLEGLKHAQRIFNTTNLVKTEAFWEQVLDLVRVLKENIEEQKDVVRQEMPDE